MSETTTPPVPTKPVREASWAKPIISVYTLTIFAGCLAVAFFTHDEKSLGILIGAATTMATMVGQYWLGSSAGSDRKTEIIANSPPVTGDK